MGRKILAVIAGYLSMAAFIFITFTLIYLIIGADGAFESGSYKVSFLWVTLSIIFSLIAAAIGGYVCTVISSDKKTAYILAIIVLILGVAVSIPAMNLPEEEMNKVREGNVPNMEAMHNAKQPSFFLVLNPLLGMAGVIIGSRLKKNKSAEIKEQLA